MGVNLLQHGQLATLGLEFYKPYNPAWQTNDAVGHAALVWRLELVRNPAHLADSPNKIFFNVFFFHVKKFSTQIIFMVQWNLNHYSKGK